jgi:hypothetical protein
MGINGRFFRQVFAKKISLAPVFVASSKGVDGPSMGLQRICGLSGRRDFAEWVSQKNIADF